MVHIINAREQRFDDAFVSTYAHFIHGRRSLVEFCFPAGCDGEASRNPTKELGGILLVFTVTGRAVLVQKLSFVQVKKPASKKRLLAWNIDRGQLYLSSRFPAFRPVGSSLFRSPKRYHISNTSGSLGSFALLDGYGSMVWISASLLEACMGRAKTINHQTLARLYSSMNVSAVDLEALLVCHDLAKQKDMGAKRIVLGSANTVSLGSCLTGVNVHAFTEAYLRGSIGEPTYLVGGFYNAAALGLLFDIVDALKTAARARARDENLLRLVGSFDDLRYNLSGDPRSGAKGDEGELREPPAQEDDHKGMGIIHTVVRLR